MAVSVDAAAEVKAEPEADETAKAVAEFIQDGKPNTTFVRGYSSCWVVYIAFGFLMQPLSPQARERDHGVVPAAHRYR